MNIKQNQQGIAGLTTVLVIVIVGLIGAVGWLVYDRSKTSKNTDTPKQSQKVTNFEECAKLHPVTASYPSTCTHEGKTYTQKIESTKDDTKDWLLYESSSKHYSIKLADGWKVYAAEDDDGSICVLNNMPDPLAILAGKRATVTKTGGVDGLAFNLNIFNEDEVHLSDYGQKQTPIKTNAGAQIEVYKSVVKEDQPMASAGTEFLHYVLSGKGGVMVASYQRGPQQLDRSEVVEKVLKTIKFN